METAVNREVRIATAQKVVERHLSVIRKLFRVSGTAATESLSPAQRTADAGKKIGRGYRLLGTRRRHPELQDLFSRLEHECGRAEERMEKYKQHWRLG